MKSIILSFIVLFSISACQKADKQSEASQQEETPVKVWLELAWQTDSIFNTPEAVRYNAAENLIYVMNMGVKPNSEKDGDGTISTISVDGEVIEMEWVIGLNSPKGADFQNGKLYVADIDQLVKVDMKSQSIEEIYPSIDPKFLNDVAVAANGDVYFTDTGSDQVMKLSNGEVSVWKKIKDLNPNGVFIEMDRILIISYGLGEFYAFNKTTGEQELLATGIKGGDGIVSINEGYIISTWPGEIYFVGKNQRGGEASKILDTKDAGLNAADITLIPEKNLLVVPNFLGNSISAYTIKVE
jgi:hypothetical protein